MIDLSHFEKNAGFTADALKYLYKHPLQVLLPAAGVYSAVQLADKIHPIHQMYREETKNKIMNDQRRALGTIVSQLKKNKEPEKKGPRIIKPPLA